MLLLAVTQATAVAVTLPADGKHHDQQDSNTDGEEGTGQQSCKR